MPPVGRGSPAEVWAARRADLDVKRQLKLSLTDSVDGVIVNQLSGLSVEDEDTWRHYICPVGGRLDSLPSKQPFDVSALQLRVVWTARIRDAAQRVKRSVRVSKVPTDLDDASVAVGTCLEVTGNPPVGLARHPLVVASWRDVVVSHFDDGALPAFDELSVAAPESLSQALELVRTPAACDLVEALAVHTRSVAFNADRYLHSIALALQSSPPKLHVSVRSESRLVALVIAVAMLSVDTNGVIGDLLVHVDEGVGTLILDRIAQKAVSAFDKGCRVVSLSEACASLC